MSLTKTIDALGYIRKQIEVLEKRGDKLKDKIVAHGPGFYEGDIFVATVSQFERENLDIEAARAKLSPQFIRAHTLRQTVTTVKVAEA